MSDLATVRVAIKATIEGVTNIGKVYDYERYAKRTSEFEALFLNTDFGGVPGNNVLLGWFFFREQTQELDGDTGEVRRLHLWRFYGFNAVNDANATAKSFQVLVEDIAAAFRADPTLGGVIDDNKNMDSPFGPVGLQVDGIENVTFADVLCHRARLSLTTETTEPK